MYGYNVLIVLIIVICLQLKWAAVEDVYAPSGRLVEDKMANAFGNSDFNLPRPSALVRLTNRARQNVRPKDPESLEFEVRLRQIHCIVHLYVYTLSLHVNNFRAIICVICKT